MIWLKAIPLRFYIYAAIALAFAGLLAKDHFITKRLNKARAELSQANANLAAERKYRQTEQDDRRRSDAAVTSLQAELDRINGAPKPVSVFCRPATLPGTAGQGQPATGSDGSPIGQGAEGPLRDIGAAVADVWREHQSNAARQRALIQWELDRTH
jgi:hypothetical protein